VSTKNLIALVATIIVTFSAMLSLMLHYDSTASSGAIADWSYPRSDERRRTVPRDSAAVIVGSDGSLATVPLFPAEPDGTGLFATLSNPAGDFVDMLFDLDALLVPESDGDNNLDGSLVFIFPSDTLLSFSDSAFGSFNSLLRLGNAPPQGFAGGGRINSGGGNPAGTPADDKSFEVVGSDGQSIDSGTLELKDFSDDGSSGPESQEGSDDEGPELIALIIDDEIINDLLGSGAWLGSGACFETTLDAVGDCENLLADLLAGMSCTNPPETLSHNCENSPAGLVDDTQIGDSAIALSSTEAAEPGSALLLGCALLLAASHRRRAV